MKSSDIREQNLEALERLCESELDKSILALDDESFNAVSQLVNEVLDRERKGFDRFFESISQTLKYIPNFIVLAITNKYIDPPIAARITSKLPIKNAVQIAKGLSVSYITETAIYLDEAYAAELLAKLPKKTAIAIVSALNSSHPLRLLDILEHAQGSFMRALSIDKKPYKKIEGGLNEVRVATLAKL
jgi:hypothetical protein